MAAPAELERRLLGGALAGMAAGAVALALWMAWQFVRGPKPEAPESGVAVRELAPGMFKLAEPPQAARRAPGNPTRWLLLRDAQGVARAFVLPVTGGRVTLPVDGDAQRAGVPCDDIAPDFARGDIACRQARPGFEFALRHRWRLDGTPLSDGTAPLPRAPGVEHAGVWRIAP